MAIKTQDSGKLKRGTKVTKTTEPKNFTFRVVTKTVSRAASSAQRAPTRHAK